VSGVDATIAGSHLFEQALRVLEVEERRGEERRGEEITLAET
jgi:hypothetical protein